MTERDDGDKRLLRNARRRVNRARDFPENTCSASRHLHMIARSLAAGKPYPMLTEEPLHCALTMLAVLESLWKVRTEIVKLRAEIAADKPDGRVQIWSLYHRAWWRPNAAGYTTERENAGLYDPEIAAKHCRSRTGPKEPYEIAVAPDRNLNAALRASKP